MPGRDKSVGTQHHIEEFIPTVRATEAADIWRLERDDVRMIKRPKPDIEHEREMGICDFHLRDLLSTVACGKCRTVCMPCAQLLHFLVLA